MNKRDRAILISFINKNLRENYDKYIDEIKIKIEKGETLRLDSLDYLIDYCFIYYNSDLDKNFGKVFKKLKLMKYNLIEKMTANDFRHL